jgi:hypothetical protein
MIVELGGGLYEQTKLLKYDEEIGLDIEHMGDIATDELMA